MLRTVLLEVIERKSKVPLLSQIQREEIQKEYESEWEFLRRIKIEYLKDVENDIKYKPSVKKVLESIDWCVEGIVV